MNYRLLHDGEVWLNHYDRVVDKFMRYPFHLESGVIDYLRGESFTPPTLTTKIPRSVVRRNVKRAKQIEMIARDVRMTSRARHTQTALIDDVMMQYSVSRANARRLISMARKLNLQVV